MASNRLTENERDKLGAAAVTMNPQIIQTMQKVFVSKIASFVIDKQADYKTIKLAVRSAGY